MADPSVTLARKILWRLALPTIFFMFLSSLDRVNVSFAALGMNADVGLKPRDYGLGAGILLGGFLVGQYPSILLMQRAGFRRWLAVLAIFWGTAATLMAFIHTPMQFYVLRVLIGVAEGGLAPGIVVYLGQFAFEKARASTFAMPMLAIPLSLMLGSPISGWLLDMHAPAGLASWRWMFLIEGVPTLIAGFAAWFYFPDTPGQARWITAADRALLAQGGLKAAASGTPNDWAALRNPMVWASALLWFCLLSGAYGIMFWLPQMVHQMTSLSAFGIGIVNALPWLGAAVGIYFNAAHSDRTGERFWHIAVPSAVAGLALLGASQFGAGALGLALLFVAGLGLGAAQGAFWALPTTLFVPATFAVGVVAINILGTSGGIVFPPLIGWAREKTGNFMAPTLMMVAVMFAAAIIALVLRARMTRSVA